MFRLAKVRGAALALAVAVGSVLAVPSVTLAQAATPAITLPTDLGPVGIINKVLADNAGAIGALIGFIFLSGLIVAAMGIVQRRFGKKGGSVVR